MAWRRQHELKLPLLLALGLALQIGWVVVHITRGVHADYDSAVAYPAEGNALLDGTYPSSEYPPGAVLLFAFDTLVGGGETRVSHAFAVVPFQLLLVAAIWFLRTQWSAWFAAIVALSPANAFFWEFKFDLVPTALLALGLLVATREQWLLSGLALGLGAATKWTPALAVAALALWLIVSRRRKTAAVHVLGAVGAFVAVNAPFLVWSPHEVLDAYRIQGGRGLIGESLAYIPLKLFGQAEIHGAFWDAADVPRWANGAAIAAQGAAVLASLVIVATRGTDRRAAVATAAMVPVVFLVFNRVFSPQFLVLLTAAWAVAGSLLARTRRDQLLLGILIFGATLSNALVYPTLSQAWGFFSGVLFLFSLIATGWVYVRCGVGRSERAVALRPSAGGT